MIRLRELRKDSDLTMKDLGIRLGIAESTVSAYETGKREPDIQMIFKLADFFRVSADYLLGRDGASALGTENLGEMYIGVSDIEKNLVGAFRDIGKKFGQKFQEDILDIFIKLGE